MIKNWNFIQEIDIAVAPMKMTAEREEVIDFVAPYYEQTGILIGQFSFYYTLNTIHSLFFIKIMFQKRLFMIFCSDSKASAPDILIQIHDCLTS